MKILLISVSAPPKNSPESLQTGRYIKYIAPQNEVTLLTTEVSGGWEPADDSLLQYIQAVKKVFAVKTIHPRVVSLLKKIRTAFLFPDDAAPFLWKYGQAVKMITEKPNVIFSRSAPFSSALMGLKFAEHFNVPWVVHFSDPWADSPYMSYTGMVRRRHEKMERTCVEKASIVTLTSEKSIDFYKLKYPQFQQKFRFLPNVFDADDINTTPLDFGNKLRFVFTGRLYGNRSIHSLIDAIEAAVQLRPELEDKFELVLAGFFVDENTERIRRSFLKNINYVGPLSMKEAMKLQHSATALISIDALESDPRFDMFFPSKLLDYLASRRLIVAITGKSSTTFDVIEGKFGRCFSPENLKELPAYLISIVEHYLNRDERFFEISSAFMEYSARHNAGRLEEMLKEAVGYG
jgi:glycosyltransferase involved in cell wall biosynthesis